MGMRFSRDTDYRRFFKATDEQVALKMGQTVAHLLGHKDGVILVSEKDGDVSGMIALLVYDHPFSGERTAFEVFWWVEPEARGIGLRLLEHSKDWAREQGATAMQMVAPSAQIGKLYETLGFEWVEASYQREL